ncbi:MAG TPA: hypothetical protein QGF02_03425 [Candidatus Babeliales bacterium]|nr:hypothetical protein [Candidatus Babeliales bacterium]
MNKIYLSILFTLFFANSYAVVERIIPSQEETGKEKPPTPVQVSRARELLLELILETYD